MVRGDEIVKTGVVVVEGKVGTPFVNLYIMI